MSKLIKIFHGNHILFNWPGLRPPSSGSSSDAVPFSRVSSCSGFIRVLYVPVWSTVLMCGGDLPQPISWIEWSLRHSDSLTHLQSLLISHHSVCAAMLHPYLYFTGIITGVAPKSWDIACSLIKSGAAILDLPLHPTLTALMWGIGGLPGMMPVFSPRQLKCGTLFLQKYFLRSTIFSHLSVVSTRIWERHRLLFNFYFILLFLYFLICFVLFHF